MTQPSSTQPRFFRRRSLVVAVLVCLSGVAVAVSIFVGNHSSNGNAAESSVLKLEDIPFNGTRAYESLQQLCAIGPRPSGSPGMAAQQKLLAEHFQKLGGQVEFQRFRVPHPQNGSPVSMANLIVRWNPRIKDRILLCAHYDTLPYPMQDRENPRGVFIGANDGGSGVAVLMELAHDMAAMDATLGVDFVMLDGEEFRFSGQDRFFLGSEYFAREYMKTKPRYRYRWGVLLDMVGDADLQIPQERNSLWWKDTRPLVEVVWSTAARLGVREFLPKPGQTIDDDHVMLHDVGGISCIDVIDFDYPPWHTQGDTADKCSPLSLAKVGWVIREWLKTVE